MEGLLAPVNRATERVLAHNGYELRPAAAQRFRLEKDGANSRVRKRPRACAPGQTPAHNDHVCVGVSFKVRV